MKKNNFFIMFLLNSGLILLLVNFSVKAITLRDFRTSYLDKYKKLKNYRTKLDLVKAYEKLDTVQDRQLADRELSTLGISIDRLRKEIAATEAKQKQLGVEPVFKQFLQKFADQVKPVSADIVLINSNLSRLRLPQARGLQNIEKQHEFLKQKLSELKRRAIAAIDYANSVIADVSQDLYDKMRDHIKIMDQIYYALKDEINNIDQKISQIKTRQQELPQKQKELEEKRIQEKLKELDRIIEELKSVN